MINLLPPAEKDKIYSNLLKKQINSLLLFASFTILMGAFLIFNTYIFLKIHISEIAHSLNFKEVNQEAQDAKDLENTIGQLNNMLVRYQNFQGEKVSGFRVFTELQKIVPVGAKLNALNFDAPSRKIIMGGQAQSRDDVLLLENRLKTSNIFYKLESPLSNFLEKNNPTFSFTFYLK